MQNDQVEQAEQMLEDNRNEIRGKWLTFWLDKQLFGVSIANVEQIVSMRPVTEVPEYPAYARGMINLRGSVVPLVDLRMCLGQGETAYNSHTCIIIIGMEDGQVGFIVDEVDAVQSISEDCISPPPQMGAETTKRYLTGVARITAEDGLSEKTVLCIDAARVLREDERKILQRS